ncbi:hypothetical protein ACERK3_07140 [Phycisphaerales bacterium AB-hyl4]|uniref:Uncharacterized protein n=1 Tax=Natronomicrosphaera hydrolytica TaxID=3242702 RepID=A0ABV4U399_9BACT
MLEGKADKARRDAHGRLLEAGDDSDRTLRNGGKGKISNTLTWARKAAIALLLSYKSFDVPQHLLPIFFSRLAVKPTEVAAMAAWDEIDDRFRRSERGQKIALFS